MGRIRRLVLTCGCLLLLAVPRPAQGQIWEGALGGAMGVAAGGYITLSIVVARAQAGHYLHDVEDLLGWNSVPVLVGGGTGLALGIYEPERLKHAVIVGSAGTVAGGLVGLGLGASIWEGPEGKWAGASIGAGAGMAIGSIIGMLLKVDEDEDNDGNRAPSSAGIPIGFTIRF